MEHNRHFYNGALKPPVYRGLNFLCSAICGAQYSACKNYVLYVPECVGNYSIPTANGNVEGVDMATGAGILNFLNISHNRPPLMPIIVLLIIFGFVV